MYFSKFKSEHENIIISKAKPIEFIEGNQRSSRPDVFCEKGALRNFAKFKEKYLCQSLSLNKAAGAACNFIKKETLAQVFSCEFCDISKNTFFYRTPPLAASDGLKSEHVLGDNMCMLRSLKDVFSEEFPVESITKPLQRELLTNHGFYQQFTVDNIDVLVELDKFWAIH